MWSKVWIVLWGALLAALLAFELYSVFDKSPRTMPLTQWTIRFVPWYVGLPFFGWLFVHFGIRYWKYTPWGRE